MLPEPIRKAARVVRGGGVIAYPTEGVFGLGCLPEDMDAVVRVLRIKRRDPSMGLVLIAAWAEQLEPYADLDEVGAELTSSSSRPVTWIVPARDTTPYWVTGAHEGVAVRITAHGIAAALCAAADSALISTSANFSGQPATRNPWVLRRRFRSLVDYVVPGSCGPATGASEIRVLRTGEVVRAASD